MGKFALFACDINKRQPIYSFPITFSTIYLLKSLDRIVGNLLHNFQAVALDDGIERYHA